MTVREIASDKEFSSFVESGNRGKIILFDFYAPWCAPCMATKSLFEDLAARHTSVVFARGNVDCIQETASGLEVIVLPTFMAFRDGAKIEELRGSDRIRLQRF